MSEQNDIDFKAAIKIAREAVADVFQVDVAATLLEEIISGDSVFTITISFPARVQSVSQPFRSLGSFGGISGASSPREYKRVRVRKADGEVEAIEMRLITAEEAA